MNENTASPPREKNKRNTVYIVIIVLLVVSNILLLVSNLNQRKQIRAFSQTTDILDVTAAGLEGQRHALLLRIDSLDNVLLLQTGLNDELDELVDSFRTELRRKKYQYSNQLERSTKLADEIAKLEQELELTRQSYLLKIAQMKERLGIVEEENLALKDSVTRGQERIVQLSEKVKTGEVMHATNVFATGMRTKNNGNEVETDRAKQAEKIKVCFSFVENRLATSGNKPIVLRVVNPTGETMMVEALGGGSFTLAENDQQSLYTTKADIGYNPNDPGKTRCMTWTPQTKLAPGGYRVELYHEGYLIGKAIMTLKKGLL